MQWKVLCQAVMVIVAMSASSALAAPTCPINQGARADAKPNKLFLYFPAATVGTDVDPSVFPSTGFDHHTAWLPLHKFDIADLPAYGGTAEELIDAIYDVVTDIY